MRGLLPIASETSRTLVVKPPLTDAEFEAMCLESDFFSYERTREGEILMHSPTGGFTGNANSEINAQLHSWWKTHREGKIFDSSTGFFLPDTSMLSPDASYVLPQKLKNLKKDDLTGFPRICPDFVIELLSVSDVLSEAQAKMGRWIENGASLAWLIDPYQHQVYVYQSTGEVHAVTANAIQGTGPVEGFVFDLVELWRCYEI